MSQQQPDANANVRDQPGVEAAKPQIPQEYHSQLSVEPLITGDPNIHVTPTFTVQNPPPQYSGSNSYDLMIAFAWPITIILLVWFFRSSITALLDAVKEHILRITEWAGARSARRQVARSLFPYEFELNQWRRRPTPATSPRTVCKS